MLKDYCNNKIKCGNKCGVRRNILCGRYINCPCDMGGCVVSCGVFVYDGVCLSEQWRLVRSQMGVGIIMVNRIFIGSDQDG